MLVNNPPVEIADNFWMLGSAPYPLYLYRGQKNGTLFEGGAGAMGPVLDRQLTTLGIGRDYVRHVILTHAHPDHVMALPLFRELFQHITVLASAPAAKTLSAEKAVALFGKLDDMLTNSLTEQEVVQDPPPRPENAEQTFVIDRVLSEGDSIPVDEGVAFTVLETPGHSDCSLSFWQPEKKILLISDATGYYIPEQRTWWPNYFTDYAVYVQSIERLSQLGAKTLCLSHNAVVQGETEVAEYLQGALEATRDYHQRIVESSRSGQTVREIAELLGSEIYELTPLLPLDFFQKNCGQLVKQSLQHEGQQ